MSSPHLHTVKAIRKRLSQTRVRWRLTSPRLRLMAQAGITAVVAVAGFAFLTTRSEINETAASVLVAVVFGVTTVIQVRQAQRRQHTVELIINFQSSDVLSAADTWMAMRITSGKQVDVDIAPENHVHVVSILDYYEFVSTLALRGFIDMRLLLRLRGGTMARCFEICQPYIVDRQTNVGDELYRSFESLVSEHSRRNRVTNSPER